MWRAIRYGLDGELLDLERGESYPAAETIDRLLELDGADARRARNRRLAAAAQRRPAPASDDRGGRGIAGDLSDRWSRRRATRMLGDRTHRGGERMSDRTAEAGAAARQKKSCAPPTRRRSRRSGSSSPARAGRHADQPRDAPDRSCARAPRPSAIPARCGSRSKRSGGLLPLDRAGRAGRRPAPIRDALSQLQLAYVRIGGQPPATEPAAPHAGPRNGRPSAGPRSSSDDARGDAEQPRPAPPMPSQIPTVR